MHRWWNSSWFPLVGFLFIRFHVPQHAVHTFQGNYCGQHHWTRCCGGGYAQIAREIWWPKFYWRSSTQMRNTFYDLTLNTSASTAPLLSTSHLMIQQEKCRINQLKLLKRNFSNDLTVIASTTLTTVARGLSSSSCHASAARIRTPTEIHTAPSTETKRGDIVTLSLPLAAWDKISETTLAEIFAFSSSPIVLGTHFMTTSWSAGSRSNLHFLPFTALKGRHRHLIASACGMR